MVVEGNKMDIRALSLRATLLLYLLSWNVPTIIAEDSNAVAGSAWDRGSRKPLEKVKVEIFQDQKVLDYTREEDGAFVLKVPVSIRRFDIQYSKAGYLNAWDLAVTNNQDQQKRPIAKLRPKSQIKDLSPEELKGLLQDAASALDRAQEVDRPEGKLMLGAAKENIQMIMENVDMTDPEIKDFRQMLKRSLNRTEEIEKKLEKP